MHQPSLNNAISIITSGGGGKKKNKGMTICSQRLNQNHSLPFPETHIPSTSKRIYGRNELIV